VRRYLLEHVDDVAVVQIYADGFPLLSLREKQLVWHLYLAALAGRDIYYDQRYAHNLELRTVLEGILTHARTLEPAVEREIVGIPVVVEPPTGVDPASLVVDPPTIQVRLLGVETLVSQVHAAALAAVVVPSELNGLAPGQQRTVPIRLRGVPHLVRAFSAVDSVRVTRNAPAGVPR